MSEEKKVSIKIAEAIEELMRTDINGCVTGSSMTGGDFDNWKVQPDIDVFVYNYPSLIHAIDILEYKLGYTVGKCDRKSQLCEEWKADVIRSKPEPYKRKLSTVSLSKDGVVVNVSCKSNQATVVDVISNFDMSIVMVGVDIKTGFKLDLRGDDPMTATPNPLRNQDCSVYTIDHWTRQFDRVIKYYDRGFDTRPMAEYYEKMLSECLATGNIFLTERSQEIYEEFEKPFTDRLEKIRAWIKEHKED